MKQNIKKGRYLFYEGEVYDLGGGGDSGEAMEKAEEALAAAQTAQQTADGAAIAAGEKAPIYHASEDNTYGVGDGTNYGHVKLSDTPDASQDAAGGVAATPAAVQAAIDQGKWTLLWTNASPTSQFAAQTISLDLSAYDYVAIDHCNNNQDDHQIIICRKGQTARLERVAVLKKIIYVASREASVSATGVAFTVATQGTNTAENATTNGGCVPNRIWGIKE